MDCDMTTPELDRIAPNDANLEKIADGFSFAEGPVWNAKGGYLLFSDIPNGKIHKWSPSEGASVFREPSWKSNGLTYDRQCRLLACEHVARRRACVQGIRTPTAARLAIRKSPTRSAPSMEPDVITKV